MAKYVERLVYVCTDMSNKFKFIGLKISKVEIEIY